MNPEYAVKGYENIHSSVLTKGRSSSNSIQFVCYTVSGSLSILRPTQAPSPNSQIALTLIDDSPELFSGQIPSPCIPSLAFRMRSSSLLGRIFNLKTSNQSLSHANFDLPCSFTIDKICSYVVTTQHPPSGILWYKDKKAVCSTGLVNTKDSTLTLLENE